MERELLPMPKVVRVDYTGGSYPIGRQDDGDYVGYDDHVEAMQAYARANVEAATEALRKEVERLMGCLATANANHEQFERQWYLERDRAERLAEALRGMLDVAAESFANRTYVPINCQQAANAYAALAQEDRNG